MCFFITAVYATGSLSELQKFDNFISIGVGAKAGVFTKQTSAQINAAIDMGDHIPFPPFFILAGVVFSGERLFDSNMWMNMNFFLPAYYLERGVLVANNIGIPGEATSSAFPYGGYPNLVDGSLKLGYAIPFRSNFSGIIYYKGGLSSYSSLYSIIGSTPNKYSFKDGNTFHGTNMLSNISINNGAGIRFEVSAASVVQFFLDMSATYNMVLLGIVPYMGTDVADIYEKGDADMSNLTVDADVGIKFHIISKLYTTLNLGYTYNYYFPQFHTLSTIQSTPYGVLPVHVINVILSLDFAF